MRGRRAVAVRAMYAGPAEEAERLLRPLRAVAGPALFDGLLSTTFGRAAMGGAPPRQLDLFGAGPTTRGVSAAACPG